MKFFLTVTEDVTEEPSVISICFDIHPSIQETKADFADSGETLIAVKTIKGTTKEQKVALQQLIATCEESAAGNDAFEVIIDRIIKTAFALGAKYAKYGRVAKGT